MTRVIATVLAIGLGAGAATGAFGQSGGKIPVTEDLRREQRLEDRIDRRPAPVDPNVTPTNPSGVVGFDGPPGTVGDSVGSYGSLPQGVSGNDIR